MKPRTPISLLTCSIAFALNSVSVPAYANTVQVEMLDKGPEGSARVFRPAVIYVDPGDTVHFVATDFGHDVQSVNGLQPEGAKSFSGYKNAPLTVTFSEPGIHVYECESHRKKGMVGAVVVGNASTDVEDVRSEIRSSDKISEKGEARLNTILEKIATKNAE